MKILNLNNIYSQFLGRTMLFTLSRYHTHYPYCEHNRDATRILLSHFMYTDKNTSEIIPKPLKRKGLHNLIKYLKKGGNNIHNQPNANEL